MPSISNRQLLRVEGVAEIVDRIGTLVDRATGKHIKKVYRDAALLVSNQARENIRSLGVSQKLKDVLTASVVTNEGPENLQNAVSAVSQHAAQKKMGGKMSGNRFPNPYWFEYGTAARSSGGASRGQISPSPFFRPAVSQQRSAVLYYLTAEFRKIVALADQATKAGKNPRREFFE